MNNVLKIVLAVLAVLLTYMVYNSVQSEIEYQEDVARIEGVKIEKLTLIRDAQMAYRDKYGKFTNKEVELLTFIKQDSFIVKRQFGDKDDSTTVFKEITFKVSVRDSLFRDVMIDSLLYVPPADTVKFKMYSSTIEQNNVTVPVFKVEDPYPFSRERSNKKNPNPLAVGSLSEADYSGNW
jgi:hypothetical protein